MKKNVKDKTLARAQVQVERHEAKYIIPRALVPEIREYIAPFCLPDPNGTGDPPEYTITTIQFDTEDLALHHAKERESLNRFKLRVRTYGEPGSGKIFLEVKRKFNGVIVKSRASIPYEAWSEALIRENRLDLRFRNRSEEDGFLEFKRLVRETGAAPVLLLRYVRESYFGKIDHYARVTFDRQLCYLPSSGWTDWGAGREWIAMDTGLVQRQLNRFSGVVLELKTLKDAPHWMIDVVKKFDLMRCGNCKYSSAIWAESLFSGRPGMPDYSAELLDF